MKGALRRGDGASGRLAVEARVRGEYVPTANASVLPIHP